MGVLCRKPETPKLSRTGRRRPDDITLSSSFLAAVHQADQTVAAAYAETVEPGS